MHQSMFIFQSNCLSIYFIETESAITDSWSGCINGIHEIMFRVDVFGQN